MTKMRLKKTKRISKFDIYIIIIILIIFITFIKIKLFTVKSYPVLLSYAKNESLKISALLINNSLKEIINSSDMEIMTIKKNDSGEISDVEFNDKKSNELNYLINDNILSNIKLLESGNLSLINSDYFDLNDLIYKIPMGLIYDFPVFVNITPKIPIKTTVLNSIESVLKTNVKEYGINNSLIEIILVLNMEIQVILPFSAEIVTIEKEIPLDTKIIQGKIPQYYGGIISSKISSTNN